MITNFLQKAGITIGQIVRVIGAGVMAIGTGVMTVGDTVIDYIDEK